MVITTHLNLSVSHLKPVYSISGRRMLTKHLEPPVPGRAFHLRQGVIHQLDRAFSTFCLSQMPAHVSSSILDPFLDLATLLRLALHLCLLLFEILGNQSVVCVCVCLFCNY